MTGEWIRSPFCESNQCIEVLFTGDYVQLRTDRSGPVIVASRAEWDVFLAGVKAGDFDGDRGGCRIDWAVRLPDGRIDEDSAVTEQGVRAVAGRRPGAVPVRRVVGPWVPAGEVTR